MIGMCFQQLFDLAVPHHVLPHLCSCVHVQFTTVFVLLVLPPILFPLVTFPSGIAFVLLSLSMPILVDNDLSWIMYIHRGLEHVR